MLTSMPLCSAARPRARWSHQHSATGLYCGWDQHLIQRRHNGVIIHAAGHLDLAVYGHQGQGQVVLLHSLKHLGVFLAILGQRQVNKLGGHVLAVLLFQVVADNVGRLLRRRGRPSATGRAAGAEAGIVKNADGDGFGFGDVHRLIFHPSNGLIILYQGMACQEG